MCSLQNLSANSRCLSKKANEHLTVVDLVDARHWKHRSAMVAHPHALIAKRATFPGTTASLPHEPSSAIGHVSDSKTSWPAAKGGQQHRPATESLFSLPSTALPGNTLFNMGAEISVLLPSHVEHRQKPSSSPLQAANGSSITANGLQSFTLDFWIAKYFPGGFHYCSRILPYSSHGLSVLLQLMHSSLASSFLRQDNQPLYVWNSVKRAIERNMCTHTCVTLLAHTL